MSRTRKSAPGIAVAWLLLFSLCRSAEGGEVEVPPAYATEAVPGANIDSVAVWVSQRDPSQALLFVTEKEGDRIQVREASTGRPYGPTPYLGGKPDSSEPGQFDRPNGVLILYHVPSQQGFVDLLLVTDRYNDRVQVFRVPELTYAGQFGSDELGNPYGLAWYHDGGEFYVFISDSVSSGKIKKYRLFEEGGLFTAELLTAFGESSGPGSLNRVESIVADPANNRLHVCGDEGGDFIRVFTLDGRYTGITYGEPEFQSDQEGIVLYDTGRGEGYIVVSDQRSSHPNEFEVFDRASLRSLGHFQSPAGGSIVTRNTDGACLSQRAVSGFPNGIFCAVNDDKNVHVYDWTSIAEAMNLRIVGLERPSPLARSAQVPERSIFFHDGSWWAFLPTETACGLFRLEEGVFALKESFSWQILSGVSQAESGTLLLLAKASEVNLLRFRYRPEHRKYEGLSAVPLPSLQTAEELDLIVGGSGRAWIAAVQNAHLILCWSSDDGFTQWICPGKDLGTAAGPCQFVKTQDGLGAAWITPGGAAFSQHRGADPPEKWSEAEAIAEGSFSSLTAASAGPLVICACGLSEGGGAVFLRSEERVWTHAASLPATCRQPVLTSTQSDAKVWLFTTDYSQGRKASSGRVVRYEVQPAPFKLTGPTQCIAWPGVSFLQALAPRDVPPEARSVVAASCGSDAFLHFARLVLPEGPDLSPPITLQHEPPHGARLTELPRQLTFRIEDQQSGVDRASLRVVVNGAAATAVLRGVPNNFLVTVPLQPNLGGTISVRIEAQDAADPPNRMVPFELSFSVGDTTEAFFKRSDANADGRLDISDAVSILRYLFAAAWQPLCLKSCDVTDDGRVNIADPVALLTFLFAGGSHPEPPFEACGPDATPDELTCNSFPPCGG